MGLVHLEHSHFSFGSGNSLIYFNHPAVLIEMKENDED
jgi:hypothetical protein